MIEWIKQHRTYTLIFVLSVAWIIWLGYNNVWYPGKMIADAKLHAGDSVGYIKELLKFIAQKDILELLKIILPFAVPIIFYKHKHKIDENITQTTNKVVRGKMGIGDRRKGNRSVTKPVSKREPTKSIKRKKKT